MSVVFVIVALFFVYQPEKTVGAASRWTNELSLAFLAGANTGTLDDPDEAKRHVADQLYSTLIYEPWVVLQFGGLQHCVDLDERDDDGYPKPVGPNDPARDVCRSHLKQGRDGHGGYAPRFLRYSAGSDEREAEFDALREGEVPSDERDGQFRGYEVDKADSPAVDVQQEHGAYQRLTLSLVFLVGSLGAVMLLGFLSLAVILAQVVALVVLGFAPVALVIGIFPGAGHDFFKNWLGKLGTALFIKALYSLVIAIVVAVSAALASSTTALGFLFAFGLQAIFFWAIFIYRKQITARLLGATTGSHYRDERAPRMTAVYRAGDVAMKPFSALVGYGIGKRANRQESGLKNSPESDPVDSARNPRATSPVDDVPSHANGHSRGAPIRRGEAVGPGQLVRRNSGDAPPRTTVNPAGNSRTNPDDGSPRPVDPPRSDDSPHDTPRASTRPPEGVRDERGTAASPARERAQEAQEAQEAEPTPRATHEDVMRRARELRTRQRTQSDDDDDGKPS